MNDLTKQIEEESVPLPIDPLKSRIGLKMMYVKMLNICVQHPDPGMAKVAADELAEVLNEVNKLTDKINQPQP